MANSNEDWVGGPDLSWIQDLWDDATPLRNLDSVWERNKALDALTERKNWKPEAKKRVDVRLGAYQGTPSLMWRYPHGIKFRLLNAAEDMRNVGDFDEPLEVHIGTDPKQVIVVEGESDLMWWAGRDGGRFAVMSLSGAKNVSSEALSALRNYDHVYIATDRDEAGEKAARAIAQVREAGTYQRIVPKGDGDWCDQAEEGYDTIELDKPRSVYSLAELVSADLGEEKDNNWFEGSILPMRGLLSIHGQKKSLKSFVMLEFARALASGQSFAGMHPYLPDTPANVLILQMEVAPYFFRERWMSTLQRMEGEDREHLVNNIKLVNMADNGMPRWRVTHDTAWDEMRTWIDEAEADVVCVDPVQRVTGSTNINQTHELDALLDMFDRIQKEYGKTVIFAHHNRKASGSSGDGDAQSGSQRFSGDPDAMASIYTPKGEKDDHGTKHRNIAWTLRNGDVPDLGVSVHADEATGWPVINFGPPTEPESEDDDAPAI